MRNQSLDVLRGVAILLVIGFHLGFPSIFRVGWLGVDIFFVLSGFLISGLLFRDFEEHQTIRLGNFWFRRAFKILPPLYVFLAVMVPLMIAFRIFPGKSFLAAPFFFSNYLSDPNLAGRFVGHTWSLAIEEHFYLFFPVLLWLLVKLTKTQASFRLLPVLCILVTLACFALRWHDPEHWAFTHLRIDGLFAGVTLRYIERYRQDWFTYFRSPLVLLAGLSFWVLPYLSPQIGAAFRSSTYTWTNIAAAFLIGWCFSHDGCGWWSLPPLRGIAYIGFNSYSVYLWQGPLCLLALENRWEFKTAGLALSIAVGVGMARLVEFPALRLRDRVIRGLRDGSQPLYTPMAAPAHTQN